MEDTIQNNSYLGTEKIGKLIRKFSIPCILSLLIASLYNLTDQIYIGNSSISVDGASAIGIVFPILIVAQAFAWCFGDGCAAFLALCQGKKDTKNAHKAVGTNILMTFAVSIILMIVALIWKEPILLAFGATNTEVENSLMFAKPYFTICAIFLPVYMIQNMLVSVIRSDGSPMYSLIATGIGAVLNILLDPLFIYVFKLGVAGAAWATVIGQTISFVLVFVYLYKPKTFKLSFSSLAPDFKIFGETTRLGISSLITQLSIVAISLCCNLMLKKYGALSPIGVTRPITAVSVETKIYTVLVDVIIGIVLGAQPIFGYNIGAGNLERVKKTYRFVLFLMLGITVLFTVINELFPQIFIYPFGNTDDKQYMDYCILTFRLFLSSVVFCCFLKMTAIFFQSVGKPGQSIACSLTRDIVLLIPSLFIFPALFEKANPGSGIIGILFTAPVVDTLSAILALVLTIFYFKQLEKPVVKDEEEQGISGDIDIVYPSKPGPVIVIAREHGSQGAYIGKLVAQELGIPCYTKEIVYLISKETGLSVDYITSMSDDSLAVENSMYIGRNTFAEILLAQEKIIKDLASKGSCIIVGRCADYILRDDKNVVSLFTYASDEFKIKCIMEQYKSTYEEAKHSMIKTDKARKAYYEKATDRAWGDRSLYSLCLNTELGAEVSKETVLAYLKSSNRI